LAVIIGSVDTSIVYHRWFKFCVYMIYM